MNKKILNSFTYLQQSLFIYFFCLNMNECAFLIIWWRSFMAVRFIKLNELIMMTKGYYILFFFSYSHIENNYNHMQMQFIYRKNEINRKKGKIFQLIKWDLNFNLNCL